MISTMANHHSSLLHSLQPLIFLVCFLLGLAVRASADVFIDCGASAPHLDDNNVFWNIDGDYVQNGVSRTVKGTNPFSTAMSTLRVFSTRKKNCYYLNVSGKVLVRVSFYYGNYDGKSSPPSFALQFDANDWATVETSVDHLIYAEAVYTVEEGDGTSICVAQTEPGQLPFISAIEARRLDSGMYSYVDSNYALFMQMRLAMGATSSIRDDYGRIWDPSTVPTALEVVKSDSVTDTSTAKDNPPSDVFLNAVAPISTSGTITLSISLNTTSSIYVNTYFSEMTQLSDTDNRSFAIFIDGKESSDIISPPYRGVDEYNMILDPGTKAVDLRPTAGSTLPPIISAMEMFVVSPELSKGTSVKDGDGLETLMKQFDVLSDWSGDPCLPVSYNWDWVECSSEKTPRITALKLGGHGLSGELPDISSMDSLQIIDLHNNSLSGGIPDFLGSMANLKELNLADNSFSGPIPASLSRNNKIKLNVDGNPNVCSSGGSCEEVSSTPTSAGAPAGSISTSPSGKKTKSNLGLALGLPIPLAFLAIVVVSVVLFLRSRRESAPVATVNQAQENSPGKPAAPPKNSKARPGNQAQEEAFTCSWKSASAILTIVYGYSCMLFVRLCDDEDKRKDRDDVDDDDDDDTMAMTDIEKQMPDSYNSNMAQKEYVHQGSANHPIDELETEEQHINNQNAENEENQQQQKIRIQPGRENRKNNSTSNQNAAGSHKNTARGDKSKDRGNKTQKTTNDEEEDSEQRNMEEEPEVGADEEDNETNQENGFWNITNTIQQQVQGYAGEVVSSFADKTKPSSSRFSHGRMKGTQGNGKQKVKSSRPRGTGNEAANRGPAKYKKNDNQKAKDQEEEEDVQQNEEEEGEEVVEDEQEAEMEEEGKNEEHL